MSSSLQLAGQKGVVPGGLLEACRPAMLVPRAEREAQPLPPDTWGMGTAQAAVLTRQGGESTRDPQPPAAEDVLLSPHFRHTDPVGGAGLQ